MLTWIQFYSILTGIRENKQKNNKNNSTYINEYTKIAFIMDYEAIAKILDRFTTNSTIRLDGWYIHKSLEGIYVS